MTRTHCEVITTVKLIHTSITFHSDLCAFYMEPFTNLLVILAGGPYWSLYRSHFSVCAAEVIVIDCQHKSEAPDLGGNALCPSAMPLPLSSPTQETKGSFLIQLQVPISSCIEMGPCL